MSPLDTPGLAAGFAASVEAPLRTGARYLSPAGRVVVVLGEIEDAVTFRAPGGNMQMQPKALFLCQYLAAPEVD